MPYLASICRENAADMDTDQHFKSASRDSSEGIPNIRNNRVCDDFQESRTALTHSAIGMIHAKFHLKSWLVETSADGESWREGDHTESNKQFNSALRTCPLTIAGGGEYHFIPLVNIGRNHCRSDSLLISAWEIFRSLFEWRSDYPMSLSLSTGAGGRRVPVNGPKL
jgi:hypothetical protein